MGNRRVLSSIDLEVPVASRERAELALDFSRFADIDLRAAEAVVRRKLHGISLYHLQQAVEKASKGFGILVGAFELDLTKLAKEIGHAPLSLLFARSSAVMLSALDAMNGVIQLSSPDTPGLLRGNVKRLLNEVRPSLETLRKRLEYEAQVELERLDGQALRIATLNLDRNVSQVNDAIEGLESNAFDKTILKLLLWQSRAALEGTAKWKNYADYVYNVVGAASRLYPLNMLTTWHQSSTRYPGFDRLGNSYSKLYEPTRPLLRMMPTLIKHSRRFCNNVERASTLAGRIGTNVPNESLLGR